MARVNTIGKDVATAGTAERLSATDLWVSWFMIEFKSGNSGSNVYRAANSSVDNTYPKITSSSAFIWSIPNQNQNLKDWWIDVDTNGDGVWITYGIAQDGAPADLT